MGIKSIFRGISPMRRRNYTEGNGRIHHRPGDRLIVPTAAAGTAGTTGRDRSAVAAKISRASLVADE